MYEQACGRDDDASQQEARYLNQLLERAHNIIYMGRSGSSGINVVRFYRKTYPQIFRETLPYTMMAFILFLGAAVAGTLLGVGTTACWQAGMALPLLSFVAPHGVLELPAIFKAGRAGLVIAGGLLFPGLLPRRDSLTRTGGQAVRLLLGTIPLLVVAGIIEGFLLPSNLPAYGRFLLAAAMGGLLALLLSRAARPAQKT